MGLAVGIRLMPHLAWILSEFVGLIRNEQDPRAIGQPRRERRIAEAAGELLLRTQEIVGRNFMTLEFYGLCGLLYFLVNSVIERLGKFASRRFALQ